MTAIRLSVLPVALTVSLSAALVASIATADAGDNMPVAKLSIKNEISTPSRTAKLQRDPQFILQTVAEHMGITIRPEVPLPKVLLESKTPLARLQAVAERQWGFRPRAFVSVFAPNTNEIYLIDDAAEHEERGSTLDDALAHEFVHYLQETYRKTVRQTDWSEYEAVVVQTWFRAHHVKPRLVAVDVRSAR